MPEGSFGQPVRRREDQRFLMGKGRYTDDIHRTGELHAVFVRSPHAHARVRSIDISAAKAMDGVEAVFTGQDMAADKVGSIEDGIALARETIDSGKAKDTLARLVSVSNG